MTDQHQGPFATARGDKARPLCVDCDETIPVARLLAVPGTARCIDCAGAAERTRRDAAERDGVVVIKGGDVRRGKPGRRQLEAEAQMPMRRR